MTLIFFTTLAAQAENTGCFYLTGHLGYAQSEAREETIVFLRQANQTSKAAKINNIAGRIGLGYHLNKNMAVEMSYLHLHKKNISTLEEYQGRKVLSISGYRTIDVFDLSVRGISYINRVTRLSGKFGLAYLNSQAVDRTAATAEGRQQLIHHGLPANMMDSEQKTVWRRLVPMLGVSMGYKITNLLWVDFMWLHYRTMGGLRLKRPGPVDFFGVGILYRWGQSRQHIPCIDTVFPVLK